MINVLLFQKIMLYLKCELITDNRVCSTERFPILWKLWKLQDPFISLLWFSTNTLLKKSNMSNLSLPIDDSHQSSTIHQWIVKKKSEKKKCFVEISPTEKLISNTTSLYKVALHLYYKPRRDQSNTGSRGRLIFQVFWWP